MAGIYDSTNLPDQWCIGRHVWDIRAWRKMPQGMTDYHTCEDSKDTRQTAWSLGTSYRSGNSVRQITGVRREETEHFEKGSFCFKTTKWKRNSKFDWTAKQPQQHSQSRISFLLDLKWLCGKTTVKVILLVEDHRCRLWKELELALKHCTRGRM